MDELLDRVTTYPALFLLCVSCGIALPIPEDLPLIYAGMQIETGRLSALPTAAVVLPAILLRDAVVYGIGLALGEIALARGPIPRLVGRDRIEQARRLVERRAGAAVLVGRLSLGFRTSVFVVAGASGIRPWQFLAWDLVGLAVTVPLWLTFGYLVGEPVVAAVTWALDHRWIALGVLGAIGAIALLLRARRR